MWLFALVACGQMITQSCEVTTRDLDDDEVSPLDLSASDLLARVEGTYSDIGTYQDDTTIEISVAVSRAEGSAQYVDQTLVSHSEPTTAVLIGTMQNTMSVECPDSLQVPVVYAVDSADGVVAFHPEATLSMSLNDWGLDNVERIEAHIDASEVTGLPAATRGEPEYAFSDGDFLDGALYGGRLGWGGSTENSSWAEYVLMWGDD